MESPIPKGSGLKEKKSNICIFGNSSPSRKPIGKEAQPQTCFSCYKPNRNETSPKIENAHSEEFKRTNIEETVHSTPLRITCGRRQSTHCIETCCRQTSSIYKTPVTNQGKTPLKVPVNPFDALLMDRLHLPVFSPSIFTKIVKTDDNEFQWNIEQQATLFPAPIEEECHEHHHMYEHLDPDTESKLQAAIDKFYESHLIAPSPWDNTKKNALGKECSSLPSKIADYVLSRARHSGSFPAYMESKGSPAAMDACTQTQISLPPQLPPEVESVLQKYMSTHEESSLVSTSVTSMESESFSTPTLRRKLFVHVEEMNISQPATPSAIVQKPSLPTQEEHAPSQASLSTARCERALHDLCHNSYTDEEEGSLPDFLESSQTTFWRDRSSPPISPIAKKSTVDSSEDKKLQKPPNEELHVQFTPPSSRTKSRPIFAYNFMPLIENDEEEGEFEFKKDKNPHKERSFQNLEIDSNPSSRENHYCDILSKIHSYADYKNDCKKKDVSRVMDNLSNTFQNRIEGFLSQKSNVTSNFQQHISVSDEVLPMEVSDLGMSRTQDTGYQTASISNVTGNSTKPRNCMNFTRYEGSLADKGNIHSRVCEDGYTSLTSIKLNQCDDESMCDEWQTNPYPIASSTPTKKFSGFLM